MSNVVILTCIITLGILLLTVCMPTDGKIIYVNKLTSSSKCLVVNDFRKCNKNVKVNVCNKNSNIYGNASLDLVNEKYGLTPCKSIPCSKGLASDAAVSNCPNCTSAKSGQRCEVEAYTSSKGKNVKIYKCFTIGSKKPVNISVEVKVCKANDTNCNITSLCIGSNTTEPPIKNPCESNPCLNGGVCIQSEHNQSEYKCNCTKPMTGEKCEELDCKPHCFQWDDTVYYILNDDDDATDKWEVAYKKCSDKDLTMAMLKDNETYRFVQFTLLNYSFNKLYVDPTFWIGAKRTSIDADWKWVDGSAVEKYHIATDAGDDRKLCVRMKAYYGMNLRETVCEAKNEYHKPLCQKTYPSLKIPRVNPCNPNPCLHGSECELTADKADYQCKKCRYPSGGKNCAELPCGATPCFAVEDSVFFLHETTSDLKQQKLIWSEANQSCARANLAMAVINDEAALHAIQVQMLILHSQEKHSLQDFWIGLNPTSENKTLTWTDGTSPGTYTKGVGVNRCLKLTFIPESQDIVNEYRITEENCDQPPVLADSKFLPLCQKLYPLPAK